MDLLTNGERRGRWYIVMLAIWQQAPCRPLVFHGGCGTWTMYNYLCNLFSMMELQIWLLLRSAQITCPCLQAIPIWKHGKGLTNIRAYQGSWLLSSSRSTSKLDRNCCSALSTPCGSSVQSWIIWPCCFQRNIFLMSKIFYA